MVNKKIHLIKRSCVILTTLFMLLISGCQNLGQYEAIDCAKSTSNKEINSKLIKKGAQEEIKKVSSINDKIIIAAVKKAVKQAMAEIKNEGEVKKPTQVIKRADIDNKIVIGSVEVVKLPNHNVSLNARIDTGATTSSINAQKIKKFERDGERWVRFEIHNHKGKLITLEKPIYKMVNIKRHEADNQKRYVVKLKLKLDKISIVSKVTLADRSNFDYPLLIGRNVLTDMAIVDVSKKFTIK